GGSHDQRRLKASGSRSGIKSSRRLRARVKPSVTIRGSVSSAMLGMCDSRSLAAGLTKTPSVLHTSSQRHADQPCADATAVACMICRRGYGGLSGSVQKKLSPRACDKHRRRQPPSEPAEG